MSKVGDGVLRLQVVNRPPSRAHATMHIVYHSDGYPETRDEKVVERVTSGLVEVNTVLDVVFRDIEESLAGAKKKNTNVAPADL